MAIATAIANAVETMDGHVGVTLVAKTRALVEENLKHHGGHSVTMIVVEVRLAAAVGVATVAAVGAMTVAAVGMPVAA